MTVKITVIMMMMMMMMMSSSEGCKADTSTALPMQLRVAPPDVVDHF
jgi:hypothetical protein